MIKQFLVQKLFALEKIYDIYICQRSFFKIEQISVLIAIFTFLGHIFLVFLNNTFNTTELIQLAGSNYFGTIFTPFGIILFYEVFSLILALPRDIAGSLTRQYQIVSLIILLRVFKDVSKVENLESLTLNSQILQEILIDLGGALLLFALIGLFNYSLRYKEDSASEELFNNLSVYKASKKAITFGLVIALVLLAGATLAQWVDGLFGGTYIGLFVLQEEFFRTLFIMLIFTDIVLVLLSYFFANTYSVIFMDAVFIISTIFIRFALSSDRPTDIVLATIAILIGISINIIYSLAVKRLHVFTYSYEL